MAGEKEELKVTVQWYNILIMQDEQVLEVFCIIEDLTVLYCTFKNLLWESKSPVKCSYHK